jgi:hypothetical protein
VDAHYNTYIGVSVHFCGADSLILFLLKVCKVTFFEKEGGNQKCSRKHDEHVMAY